MAKRTNSWSITHGMTGRRVYNIYNGMKYRCGQVEAHRYAGRGINICAGWQTFENFYADMGDCPPGSSIDRLDNDGGYWCGHCEECVANGWPANCEWHTPKQQSNNRGNNHKITAGGLTLTRAQWAERQGVSVGCIRIRIGSGWSEEDAVLIPKLSKAERMARLQAGHQSWRTATYPKGETR